MIEESKKKYNSKIDLFNLITIILFVILSLIIGHFHEPWSDEAQSWLIAREQSIKDIFFYNSKYEGTFPLWILTLKLFISLGMKYEYIYIISTIISTIGVGIVLYKTNLPRIYKIFFAFNFYTLYQYSVVARSYCYFILAFACLIALYNERHTKIIKYFLNLILFSFISLHGMVISGILALFYFIEIIKECKKEKKKISKINRKKIICIAILAIVYIFEIIILIPPQDIYVDKNYESNIEMILLDVYVQIVPRYGNYFIKMLCLIGALFLCMILFEYRKYVKKEFWMLILSVLVIFLCIRCAPHHIGIVFLIFLTTIFLIDNKQIKYYMYVPVIIYTLLSVLTGIYDINENYSGAKQMADYIKNIDNYEEKNIYGIGYKCTAISPYFEDNIFDNRKDVYYLWSKQNTDLVLYKNALQIDFDDIDWNTDLPEYIVLENYDMSLSDGRFRYLIGKSEKYDLIFETNGRTFFKGIYSETEGYYLYKLKEI